MCDIKIKKKFKIHKHLADFCYISSTNTINNYGDESVASGKMYNNGICVDSWNQRQRKDAMMRSKQQTILYTFIGRLWYTFRTACMLLLGERQTEQSMIIHFCSFLLFFTNLNWPMIQSWADVLNRSSVLTVRSFYPHFLLLLLFSLQFGFLFWLLYLEFLHIDRTLVLKQKMVRVTVQRLLATCHFFF